jgi:hypothetical protein
MQKMSPIPIALNVRSARIPIRWTVRKTQDNEQLFWPQVVGKGGNVEATEIADPLSLRAQLFNLLNTDRSEGAALSFLNRVGAWRLWDGGNRESWAEGTYVNLNYGHRLAINGRVLPITLADLLRDTGHWYRLLGTLRNPVKLRAVFKQPPPADSRSSDRYLFALDAHLSNTLPVSLEWHGKDPFAVVETVTAWELMIATAWADVVSRAEDQLCANCGTRFTWPRKKKHCRLECGHSAAVRKYKRKRSLEKQKKKTRKPFAD